MGIPRASSGRWDASPRSPRGGPILGLGTAVFQPGYGVDGSGLTADNPCALLRTAVERGVTYIDTAVGYGASEHWLGELSDLLDVHKVRLCTKLTAGAVLDDPSAAVRELGHLQVDTLLVHSANCVNLRDSRVAERMTAVREEGWVRRCGASTYGIDDACLALEQAWCDVVQVEFSVVNPSVLREVAAHRRPGQEVVARSVLGQGMLTGRRHQALQLDDEATAVLGALEARARDWGIGLEHLAIRFALDSSGIDVVLVGAGNLDELNAALGAADAPPLEPWKLESLAEFDRSHEDWTHPERWEAEK